MPQIIRPSSDATRSSDLEDIVRDATATNRTLTFTDTVRAHIVNGDVLYANYWPTMVQSDRFQPPVLSTGATAAGVIDETVPVDSDYIESSLSPLGNVIAVETDNPLTTPIHDANHFIRVRAAKNSADGQTLRLLTELRQTYTAESGNSPGITNTMGTLIASFSQTLSDTITTYRRRLTAAEAALITDYTLLQLRFVILRPPGPIASPTFQTAFEAGRGAQITEALDATETGVDVVDGALFAADDVIQIDAEIMTVDSVASNTLTVTRAARGTTGATHVNGAGIVFVVAPAARKALTTNRRTCRIYWAEVELPNAIDAVADYTPSDGATEVS